MITKKVEALARLDAIEIEQAALRKIIEAPDEPEKVFAYIGSAVNVGRNNDPGHFVVGAIVRSLGRLDTLDIKYKDDMACPTSQGKVRIGGKVVTHFQPLKLELVFSPAHDTDTTPWKCFVNDQFVGWNSSEFNATICMKALAQATAPYWQHKHHVEITR